MDRSRPHDPWDIYDRTVPPWDTGRAQPAIAQLGAEGRLRGHVLDIGCGTGEHALLAASLGLVATGIDGAESAVRIARQKALDRGLDARFLVADALALQDLDEQFDTVIDSSLFQVFSDAQRPRYVRSLAAAVPSDGHVFVLCFSDRQPGLDGPRRISQAELRDSFAGGWIIDTIEEVRLETRRHGNNVAAWLADIRRRTGDHR